MAFGFPAQEFQYLPESQLSTSENLYFALQVCKELQWTIIDIDDLSLTATTVHFGGSWNETFEFIIKGNEVVLHSYSNGNQIFDQGRNKKHIDLFINAFNYLKKKGLENPTDPLQLQETLDKQKEKIKTTAIEQPEISNFYNFFSIFIPTQGYFITPILIWANILVWLFMTILGANGFTAEVPDLIDWGGNISHLTVANGWWRLVSCMFLHNGIIHLVSNCIGLAIAGLFLESLLKKSGFLMYYFFTGLLASCCSLYWYENIVCVGASGAIFGMFGFLITALIFKSIQRKFQINSAISILVFVGINLVGSFDQGVDSAAHIGGFTSGLILGGLYHLLRKSTATTHIVNTVITVSVCATLCIIASNSRQYQYQLQEYWSGMSEFAAMEKRAIDAYYYPYGNDRDGFSKQLENISQYYWEENLNLLKDLDRLNLPENIHDLNQKSITYCKTQLEMVNYMIQDLNAGGNVHTEKIQALNIDLKNQIQTITQLIQEIKKTESKTASKK